jgi:YD repeat-containing protein
MTRLGRFGILIALCGALALVPQARAFADPSPPQGVTCQSTGSGSICHGEFAAYDQTYRLTSCGSGTSAFDAVLTYTLYLHATYYYNQAGLLVGQELHWEYADDALANAVTGTSIPVQTNHEDDRFTFTYDASGHLVAETHAQSGNPVQITLPGHGVVAHITGLAVYNDLTGQLVKAAHPTVVGLIDSTDICATLS